MALTRRDLLRMLLASPIAAAVDVEQLLWTPKPIITVPAMPPRLMFHRDAFAFVMEPFGDISPAVKALADAIDRDVVARGARLWGHAWH